MADIENLIVIAHPYKPLVGGVSDPTPSTYVNGIERQHLPNDNTAAIVIPSQTVRIPEVEERERLLAGTLQANARTRSPRAFRMAEDIIKADYAKDDPANSTLRRFLRDKGLTLAPHVSVVVEGSELVAASAARRVMQQLPEVDSVYIDRQGLDRHPSANFHQQEVQRSHVLGFYTAEVAATRGRYYRIGRRTRIPQSVGPR